MCVRIFGFSDPVALERADDLGMALQLTNILRDVREDAVDMGRVYLPQDELDAIRHTRIGVGQRRDLPAVERTHRASRRARARVFCQRLRSAPLHSAPSGRVRAHDGRHLRGTAQEDRARTGVAAARPRGAFKDGETAGRRAIVALQRVAVAGGGLAGLSAALALKARGAHVELFERGRLLGGRATSFELDGIEVDNGQHVFLACCTEFIAFAHAVGMEDALYVQPRFEATVLERSGRKGALRDRRAAGAAAPRAVVSAVRFDLQPATNSISRARSSRR